MRRKIILSFPEKKRTGSDPASNLWGAGEEIQSNQPGLQQIWDSDPGQQMWRRLEEDWQELEWIFEQL